MATYNKYFSVGDGHRKVAGSNYYYHKVYGHSFSSPYADQGYIPSSPNFDGYTIINQKTTFDLSRFRPGYMVAKAVARVQTDSAPSSGVYYATFNDSNNNILYLGTHNFNHSSASPTVSQQSQSWWSIGLSNYSTGDIIGNGNYSAELYIDSTGGFSDDYYYFTTVNYNSSNSVTYYGKEGQIWVQGSEICFVNGYGTISKVLNDGGNYGFSGTTQVGNIWVPGGGSGFKYLCYVDASGIIRHTKNGTYYFTLNSSSVTNVGSNNAGAISVATSPDQFTIKFVAADGNLVKLGQGYLYGNMY